MDDLAVAREAAGIVAGNGRRCMASASARHAVSDCATTASSRWPPPRQIKLKGRGAWRRRRRRRARRCDATTGSNRRTNATRTPCPPPSSKPPPDGNRTSRRARAPHPGWRLLRRGAALSLGDAPLDALEQRGGAKANDGMGASSSTSPRARGAAASQVTHRGGAAARSHDGARPPAVLAACSGSSEWSSEVRAAGDRRAVLARVRVEPAGAQRAEEASSWQVSDRQPRRLAGAAPSTEPSTSICIVGNVSAVAGGGGGRERGQR